MHFIHHLAPTGLAGFVLANSSMSSNQSGEGEIRKAIIEADQVDGSMTSGTRAVSSSCLASVRELKGSTAD